MGIAANLFNAPLFQPPGMLLGGRTARNDTRPFPIYGRCYRMQYGFNLILECAVEPCDADELKITGLQQMRHFRQAVGEDKGGSPSLSGETAPP